MKFNKHLSQFEAVYQVAPPVGVTADSVQISDFIHHLLENGEKYGLNDVDDDWFKFYASKHNKLAKNLVMSKLNESGHVVRMKSLNEGISQFLYEGLGEEARLKYYSDVPVEEFNKFISADPTNGTYQKWILNLRKKGLKEEDLYKVTHYLTIFDKYKSKMDKKDINQYKSLPELYTVIAPIILKLGHGDKSIESSNEQARIAKSDTDKVFDNGRFLILSPKTQESACYYGKGTQWCTAAGSSDNMFEHYNSRGKLYIIIDKQHKGQGGKWQLHQDTASFMDANDNPVREIEKTFPIDVLEKIAELYGIGNTLVRINDFDISKHLVNKYSNPESFKEMYGVFSHFFNSNKKEIALYIYNNYYELLDPNDILTVVNYFMYPELRPEAVKILSKLFEHDTLKEFPRHNIETIALRILRSNDDADTLAAKLTTDMPADTISPSHIKLFKQLMDELKKSLDARTYLSVCGDIIQQCLRYSIYEVIPYLLSLNKYDPYDYTSFLNTCYSLASRKGMEILVNDPNFNIPRKMYDLYIKQFTTGGSGEVSNILKTINQDKLTGN